MVSVLVSLVILYIQVQLKALLFSRCKDLENINLLVAATQLVNMNEVDIVLFLRQVLMIMGVLLFPVMNSWWSYNLESIYSCFMQKIGLYNCMVINRTQLLGSLAFLL